MKNSEKDCFNPFFSHIYVERSIKDHPRSRQILAGFPSAKIIEIDHYKDVFCRSRQSCILQHHTQNLILAKKEGTLIYNGAPVCQSFGNEYFCYTSCIMNCIFDCEYCYLKGMYPSANIVIFVNIEDIFKKTEQILKEHPLYLCVSYDTDLLALEHITGYVKEWSRFVQEHNDINIEIRTKCANKHFFRDNSPVSGLIYAFTLSPQAVVKAYEHGTPSLPERIACAAEAVEAGFAVRLCFDPMIYLPGWQQYYKEMAEEVFLSIDADKLVDVSVGSFRISREYLKKMRKQEPDSAVVWFPFQQENGYCHYPADLLEEMEQYLVGLLKEKIAEEKIFRWRE